MVVVVVGRPGNPPGPERQALTTGGDPAWETRGAGGRTAARPPRPHAGGEGAGAAGAGAATGGGDAGAPRPQALSHSRSAHRQPPVELHRVQPRHLEAAVRLRAGRPRGRWARRGGQRRAGDLRASGGARGPESAVGTGAARARARRPAAAPGAPGGGRRGDQPAGAARTRTTPPRKGTSSHSVAMARACKALGRGSWALGGGRVAGADCRDVEARDLPGDLCTHSLHTLAALMTDDTARPAGLQPRRTVWPRQGGGAEAAVAETVTTQTCTQSSFQLTAPAPRAPPRASSPPARRRRRRVRTTARSRARRSPQSRSRAPLRGRDGAAARLRPLSLNAVTGGTRGGGHMAPAAARATPSAPRRRARRCGQPRPHGPPGWCPAPPPEGWWRR